MNTASSLYQAIGITLGTPFNTNYSTCNDPLTKIIPDNKLQVTDNDSFHAVLHSTRSSLECMNMDSCEPMNISTEHLHEAVHNPFDLGSQFQQTVPNFQCPRKLSGSSAFMQVNPCPS